MKHHVLPVLALLAQAGLASAAPILYTHQAQSPVQSTRASQEQETQGRVFQTFDSFALAEEALITAISWQGSYFNALVSDPSFAPPKNASGFTVAFYLDDAGTPGALLHSQTFSPSNAGETLVGQQPFTTTLGLSIYNYSVSMDVLASAGTTYWLSVFALSPDPSPTEAQWGWNGGSGGNGTSIQSGLGVVNLDRAFTLEGEPTPVPEPSSLLWLGTGVSALIARVRRHKRSTRQQAR